MPRGRPFGSKDSVPRKRRSDAGKLKKKPQLRPVTNTSDALAGVPIWPPSPAGDLTPKDFLLAIMRDPAQPPERRDKAAALLLPFMHPRIAGQTKGTRAHSGDRSRTPNARALRNTASYTVALADPR